MILRRIAFLLLAFTALASAQEKNKNPRLKDSFRQEKNGWIYLYLEGKPKEIGFQHGYHLAEEIDDAIKMFKLFTKQNTGKDWKFFREAAKKMLWVKVDLEYKEEIQGMAEGVQIKKKNYDYVDLTILNGWIELCQYYVPYLAEKMQQGAGDNKAPGNCSAFIATGSYTADGKIAMGHNAWVDYIVGARWNIILDIAPATGKRMFMDAFPGFIHSGDDFVINSAGILYTETTITQFKGFNETGVPEFVRARKAAQYSESIDDFIKIMTTENNGGYANTWLIGDLNKNEIAKLELGLKNYKVWRTTDGMYYGSNFPTNEKLIAEETTFNTKDSTNSPNARKARWEKLSELNRGKIDIEVAKKMETDGVDEVTQSPTPNRCMIAGRVDTDPKGCPEWGWSAYYPGGTVQGKVTTAELAKDLKFWAKAGVLVGEDFIAAEFLKQHPEYKWQEPFLRDIKKHDWTLFETKRSPSVK